MWKCRQIQVSKYVQMDSGQAMRQGARSRAKRQEKNFHNSLSTVSGAPPSHLQLGCSRLPPLSHPLPPHTCSSAAADSASRRAELSSPEAPLFWLSHLQRVRGRGGGDWGEYCAEG